MALIIADRVKETSSTDGAGNITLSGAVTGFQSFNSAIGVGNTCYYVIENPSVGEWEVGLGTLTGSTTLTRTKILQSSDSGSVVTFSSGTKNVFVTLAADTAVLALANIGEITAFATGSNFLGTLGDGDIIDRSSPVQIIGTGWSQIAGCHGQAAAGVKTDGTLWLWGENFTGVLGDGTTTARSSPVQTIAGGTNWSSVSTAKSFSAGIKTDGTLWLWGDNSDGQLGTNNTTNTSSPIQTVCGGTNWASVATGSFVGMFGYFTLALKTDGTLWSWGGNGYGQLGNGFSSATSSPAQIIASGTWSKVSAGGLTSSLAIKSDGTLWGWGFNGNGLLADGTNTDRSSPVQTITGGSNWEQVSAGYNCAYGIKTDGTLWGWGLNSSGQIGDNTTTNRSAPTQEITAGTAWSKVAARSTGATAIKTDGTLWAWGEGFMGQIGDGTEVNRSSPVQIGPETYWISVAGGLNVAWAIEQESSSLDLTFKYDDRKTLGLPTSGTLLTDTSTATLTNKTWNGDAITGQYGGTGVANTGKTITVGGNLTTSGAFDIILTATGTTSVILPTAGTLATLAGIESLTNKTLSTNTTWNGNVIAGLYGGTGIANTGKTITIGGNLTTSGAFTTTLTSTANTSVTLPTTGTLATLTGTETLSNKTVNLAAGNATTGPLKFTSGTNMTAAAAGNMEFNGTRLFFTPSTTRQTVAFLTDITGGGGGGLTVADDTSSNATQYLIFTNATSGSVSTANTSSSKLYFNPSTGDLTAGGSITALSDRTLKNNITTITGATDKVNSLRGVEFDWVDSGDHSVGVIAQEVEDVIPEVVLTHKGLKSVAYGNLIAVLIEAIKDQDKRIKMLEALVERLVK